MSRSRRNEYRPCRSCNAYLTRNQTGLCPGCRTDPPPKQITRFSPGVVEIPFSATSVRMTHNDAITLAHMLADAIQSEDTPA